MTEPQRNTPTEKALVFDVQGSPLLGILHAPASAPRTGIVMIAAGGPQYHVGCCRQLLTWARQFADAGIAVLRFDYRGMGDSGGPFRGFEHIDEDLRAAIDLLVEQQPGIEEVVLWGGCNAASSILMYAWRDPRVRRIITLNPWAHTEATEARIQVKYYYLQRLREKSFWLKLLSGRLNPLKAASSLLGAVRKARGDNDSAPTPNDDAATQAWPEEADFVEKMRIGLQRFDGEMLLLLSGQSLMGREFDETVAASKAWQKTVAESRITRRELPEAGHTFSTHEAQRAAFAAANEWLRTHS